ncbi:MAG: kynureninase [Gemmatimonadales bacterium]
MPIPSDTAYRSRFALPLGQDGQPLIYLTGNSLGLMPLSAPARVQQVMDQWARLAVEGHFSGDDPWYTFHDQFREPMARVVGARPGEVVVMNTLTVNLHLMLATFWQPAGRRTRIVIEADAFPSDTYAVESHVQARGLDPATTVVQLRPRAGEHTLRTEDIEAFLADEGETVALVMLPGVQYYTGQLLEIERITRAAHQAGARAGFDLAHAAGNVPLALHDWNVDFAVWCTYKYLNAGPGAIAAAFVHERHGQDPTLPRLAGWWGNDPATRFRMHLNPHFIPRPGAEGWAASNPPILAMAPLLASLAIFDEATMPALRRQSTVLTGHLEQRLQAVAADRLTLLTPSDPEARGCQLSVLVPEHSRAIFDRLRAAGVVADYRQPDVIRLAPVPLYNTLDEMDQVAEHFHTALARS